jgi:hypothetical protein
MKKHRRPVGNLCSRRALLNTPNETDRYGSVTTRRTGETGSKGFAPFGRFERFGFEGSREAGDDRIADEGDVVRGEDGVRTRDHAGSRD